MSTEEPLFGTSFTKKLLKLFKDLIPIIYILLVVFGYVLKSIFYRQFDINIIDFLDIQELLFIFFRLGSYFVIGGIVISMFTFGWFIYEDFKKALDFKPRESDNKKKEPKEYKKPNENVKKGCFTLGSLVILFLIFAPILSLIFVMTKYLKLHLVVAIIMLIWSAILGFISYFRLMENDLDWQTIVGLILCMMGFFPMVLSGEISKSQEILQGKSDVKAILTMNNHSVTTDDCIMYVGQTTNYIFLRDIGEHRNLIYSKANIENISLEKIAKDEK